jgi:hypothetical protein
LSTQVGSIGGPSSMAEGAEMSAYTKPERVILKAHQEYTEKWVQARIAEDPKILGLGDLVLLQQERIQPSGGSWPSSTLVPRRPTRKAILKPISSHRPLSSQDVFSKDRSKVWGRCGVVSMRFNAASRRAIVSSGLFSSNSRVAGRLPNNNPKLLNTVSNCFTLRPK